jgi:hypothetical protein
VVDRSGRKSDHRERTHGCGNDAANALFHVVNERHLMRRSLEDVVRPAMARPVKASPAPER